MFYHKSTSDPTDDGVRKSVLSLDCGGKKEEEEEALANTMHD